MDSIGLLRDLYDYDEWAIRRLMAAVDGSSSDRTLSILAHLLTTKHEYFLRLSGKDSTGFDFWPDLSWDKVRALAEETTRLWGDFLNDSTEEDLNNAATYKTSEGVEYTNTVRELLAHVLLHSAIHRGNIILKLREDGVEPPKTDFIIYLRERT